MAEGGDEWELCKENVQPLKQGRAISTLQEALTQEGTSHIAIEQQRQALESEIRFYNGDDPLDVWDRYIKWTEQTYPQGGKESNLSTLIERVVMHFNEEKKYFNDPRYLNFWLKFADQCSEPLDLYSYLHGQGIGVSLAAFYIAWADQYEMRGNTRKADAIFQEGLKCKAEPLDKLQYHHRNFQARVSRQIMTNIADGEVEGPEAAEPQRASLVELKHKGKTKATVPISRIGDSVKHHGRGLSIQMPAPMQNEQNQRFSVFNENQIGLAESLAPRPETWSAPPTVRAKENELNPRKWNTVKLQQHPRSNATVEIPNSRPNFLPFVEESDQQPAITPCKINPTVNNVLSTRKLGKEEDPLERVQGQQQGQTDKKERAMYSAELLFGGASEFCFEEIRAELYRKKKLEEANEIALATARRKEELRRQIEEKQRLLQEAQAQMNVPETFQERRECQTPRSPVVPESAPHSVPGGDKTGFQIYVEPEFIPIRDNKPFQSENDVVGFADEVFEDQSVTEDHEFEKMFMKSGKSLPGFGPLLTNAPLSKFTPFTILDESANSEELIERPVTTTKPSVRRPLSAILKPFSDISKEAAAESLKGIEPLNEDAILSDYRNKTLCPSPENTCDFVRAAQLASTPFNGVMAQRSDSEPENSIREEMTHKRFAITPSVDEQAVGVKKLSPIMEASLEDAHFSVSSASSTSSMGGLSSVKEMVPSKLELGQSPPVCAPIEGNETAGKHLLLLDFSEGPWNTQVRRQLLENISKPLSSFPEFHMESGQMPTMEEGGEVSLGGETYIIQREAVISEGYKVYFGKLSMDTDDSKSIVIKADFQSLPWDFYINSQLRERLGANSEKYFSDQCSCHLYEEGCVTLNQRLNPHTLQDVLQAKRLSQSFAAFLTVSLLELVEQMHSAQLVHGDIRPETLLLGDCFFIEEGSALKTVDFSHSLDLDLQPGVQSVSGFRTAQAFMGQEILSECTSPYQVDLLGIADTVYRILKGRNMQVIKEDSEWKLVKELESSCEEEEEEEKLLLEDQDRVSLDEGIWYDFFKRILNPRGSSTVSVLSDLHQEMSAEIERSFQDSIEANLALFMV
ncbi:mitotic checkpoint serine/threonine-protein kinase BUB1 beta-like [Huso huso]|uniref:Mitotic checkpoint serine/threonine-protein kinase BUB1 beta-like n=1 Tax=Huso huso TaxID=61971 RepID=A0ABR0Z2W1_HUSHU